jgi:NAD(P)-dependent dehydrogenase (short-subunit alcohol dehydrogenase family)
MQRPIAGRVVAVTGGARGIGLATATALARAGARVSIGDLSGDGAAAAAEPIGGIGLALDVSDRASFQAFLDATEERLGPLDVLVNNAGVMFVGAFEDEDDRAMRRMLDVNFGGTVIGMKLAIPRMRTRGGGHIVNVASAGSFVAAPHESTYAATKHAVKGVCDGVRGELRGSGIDLSLVYPAIVQTELAAGTTPERGGRYVQPEEVADAIVACIRSPRLEVFVPRRIAPLIRAYAALPARGRMAMQRLLGIDKVATTANRAERADYEERVARKHHP